MVAALPFLHLSLQMLLILISACKGKELSQLSLLPPKSKEFAPGSSEMQSLRTSYLEEPQLRCCPHETRDAVVIL